MRDRHLDRLFVRFREKGDVKALSRVFDATSRELLELAAHVTRTPGEAEDLLQSTFLAAIEHAAQYDDSRRLMPWLAGILTREARSWNRSAARRIDADRCPAREEPDPSSSVEARELSNLVIEAIDALPVIYRDVLVRHLCDHQSPGEIARELQRAPGTVRVQIHRGLELLRKALPGGLVAGGVAGVSTRGLAQVRAQILERASRALPATAAVASSTLATLAGGIVMKKFVIAGVALILAAAAWMAWPVETADAKRTVASAETRTSVLQHADEATAIASAADVEPATRSALDVPAPDSPPAPVVEPFGSISIRVTWEKGGAPAADIGFTVSDGVDSIEGATGADGVLLLPRVATGNEQIEMDRARGKGAQGYVDVKPGERTTLDLVVPAGIDVEGIVVDGHGAPVEDAGIFLSALNSVLAGRIVARSDAEGRFRVRSVDRDCGVGARKNGRAPSELTMLRDPMLAAGTRVDLRIELPDAGGSVHGRVYDPRGDPVAGAQILVGGWQGGENDSLRGFTTPVHQLADGSARMPARPACVRTDAGGRFQVEDVEPGDLHLLVGARGWPWVSEIVHVDAGATAQVDVRLQEGATIEGTLRLSDGSPAAGVFVLATAKQLFLGTQARTDAQGRYRVEQMLSGEVRIQANPDHSARSSTLSDVIQVAPGGHARWDATLPAAASIRGRAIDESGVALSGWWVRAKIGSDWDSQIMARTADDGGFALEGCLDAVYWVGLHAPGKLHEPLPCAWKLDVKPGKDEIVLRLSAETRASAFIEGALVDSHGEPLEHARIYASFHALENAAPAECESESGTGRFRIGPLPPGTYSLSVMTKGFPYRTVGESVVRAGETLDLGTITLKPGG